MKRPFDRKKKVSKTEADDLQKLIPRYHAILESVPDIIMEVDENKVYTWANRAGYDFFGASVIGKEASFYFLGAQNTYEAVQPLFGDNEGVIYVESWQKRRDGQARLLAWWCKRMNDGTGRSTGVVSTARDITPLFEAEAILRDSEKRFKAIFDNAVDGILITDKTMKFVMANSSMCRMLGYSLDELLSLSVSDINPENSLVSLIDHFGKLIRNEEILAANIPVKRKDGRIMHADITTALIEMEGSPYVVGFFRDITEKIKNEQKRKELEEQLFQSQKMESIGRLAGGIAHNLNNLLTPIIGYSDYLLKKVLDKGDPAFELVFEINNAAGKARTLNQQLLAFGRKQALQIKVLNLNSVILNLLNILKRTVGETIDLKTNLDPELLNIEADVSQIDQIILNLTVNAQDAMIKGGVVLIETFNTAVIEADPLCQKLGAPGDYAVLRVSDCGSGIDQETLPHIFEPFFTTKAKGFGTGLGLATVYGIVKQHNGYIYVTTEIGKGSSFIIYFPAFDKKIESEIREEQTTLETDKRELILLVEDSDSVRKMTEKLIHSLGYAVVSAENGEKAIAIAESRKDIALVLTDVVIPDISGVEIGVRIARIIPNVKILYMSGYAKNVVIQHGGPDTESRFINKPFTVGELAEKIRTALNQ